MLLTANLADTNYSSQSFCLWSTKNLRYYSSSWFILSICPSVCGWYDINSFVSIPSILFNSFVISIANCGSWSDIILSSNLCNFHTLSLNNLANSSTVIPSVVATKYVILENLLQTTRITSFPAITGNFVMKSTIRCIYSFSGTSLSFNFPASAPILFFILWYISHSSTYFSISLITPSYQ